jgi:secondary thiamine-phosphate synthase enzyme
MQDQDAWRTTPSASARKRARRATLREVRNHQETIDLETSGRGFIDVTDEVQKVVRRSGVKTGLCVVFCRHTSASLVIQENADPQVQADLQAWLARAAPDGDRLFKHTAEGADDMPAHVRSAITKTSETIPVQDGRLALGTWQGLYLLEHRLRAHERSLVVHVTGD